MNLNWPFRERSLFIKEGLPYWVKSKCLIICNMFIVHIFWPYKEVDWAKYLNRHSSKSIWDMKLFFCQNSPLIGQSFWRKKSFITHILFEICLFWYLAQSTYLWDTLYIFCFDHYLEAGTLAKVTFSIGKGYFQVKQNILLVNFRLWVKNDDCHHLSKPRV